MCGLGVAVHLSDLACRLLSALNLPPHVHYMHPIPSLYSPWSSLDVTHSPLTPARISTSDTPANFETGRPHHGALRPRELTAEARPPLPPAGGGRGGLAARLTGQGHGSAGGGRTPAAKGRLPDPAWTGASHAPACLPTPSDLLPPPPARNYPADARRSLSAAHSCEPAVSGARVE